MSVGFNIHDYDSSLIIFHKKIHIFLKIFLFQILTLFKFFVDVIAHVHAQYCVLLKKK